MSGAGFEALALARGSIHDVVTLAADVTRRAGGDGVGEGEGSEESGEMHRVDEGGGGEQGQGVERREGGSRAQRVGRIASFVQRSIP